MDETVASLIIKYKADILTFKQSLAELQRAGDEFRARMEAPLKMRAGAVGAPSASGGPNIAGDPSNGNVSWSLEEAVRRTQGYADSAGSSGGGYRSRRTREQFFMSESERIASNAMPWGASSRINPYTGGRMGDTEELVKPQEKQPWWKAKLSHVALRSFAAFVVVDAVAAELNNEENYKKAVRLAGYGPEGSVAVGRAQIARTQGMFDAIPMIGGTLKNVVNTTIMGSQTFQWQEAQLDLAEQYGRYTSGLGSALRMGRGLRSSAQQFGMSRTGRAIDAANEAAVGRVTDIDGMREGLLANAGLKKQASDYYDLDPDEQSGASSIPFNIYGRSQDVARANAARNRYNAGKTATVDATIDRLKQESKTARDAQITEIRNQNQYIIDNQQSQIVSGSLAAQYRYTAAGAAGIVGGYRASVADYRRHSPNADDAAILYNQGSIAIQGLQQNRRDIMENYRWGSGREYNPMMESPMSFTDRNIESTADQLQALTTAISELNVTMKTIH